MKIYYSLFIFFIALSQITLEAQEEQVFIIQDSIKLIGTLLKAENADSKQVVLLLSGSGPTDRDGNNPMMKNNSLKFLAEDLAKNGISSLRYDKRGIAKSAYVGFDESELSFDDFISDANAWLNFLKERKEFEKFYIIGHSEGALIGLLVAQNNKVDGYVSLAGGDKSAADILKTQIMAQMPIGNEPMLEILAQLKSEKLVKEVNPMYSALFRPSVQPYLISWFKYTPTEEIAKLDCPTLILQGTTDMQITPENAKALHKALPHSKLILLEDMNHVLKTVSLDPAQNMASYSNPTLALHQDLVPSLVNFLKETSLKK